MVTFVQYCLQEFFPDDIASMNVNIPGQTQIMLYQHYSFRELESVLHTLASIAMKTSQLLSFTINHEPIHHNFTTKMFPLTRIYVNKPRDALHY